MQSNRSLIGFSFTLVIICVCFAGCDTPTPLSAIPTVIYYQAQNETRIFVTGDEYMYKEINITINNDTKRSEFSYALTLNTTMTSFQLEIRVLDNEGDEEKPEYQRYTYSASVDVEVEEENVQFMIIDDHHEKEIKRDSPYETIMEREK